MDEDIPVDSEIEQLIQKEPLHEKRRLRLAWWRGEVERIESGPISHPILVALSKVASAYDIPKVYFLTLIDGVEMDLLRTRYLTFEELRGYCYAVASIVGLISINVFGYQFPETKEYAIDLGIALQLTNILRDVKPDALRGRIYLPHEDLVRFGYSEQELLGGVYNSRFIELARFEAERAKSYYARAHSHFNAKESGTMFPAQIMEAIYFRLLQKIEAAEFALFDRRISLSSMQKVLIALKFWLQR